MDGADSAAAAMLKYCEGAHHQVVDALVLLFSSRRGLQVRSTVAVAVDGARALALLSHRAPS